MASFMYGNLLFPEFLSWFRNKWQTTGSFFRLLVRILMNWAMETSSVLLSAQCIGLAEFGSEGERVLRLDLGCFAVLGRNIRAEGSFTVRHNAQKLSGIFSKCEGIISDGSHAL